MNRESKNITIETRTSDKVRVDEAQKLIQQGFCEGHAEGGLVLSFLDSHSELRRPDTKVGNGFFVNFSSVDRRVGAGNLSKKQPLPRAVGVENKTIIDTTAGFCGDAILLALMGFDVLAIERSPIISVLLRDAMRRGEEDTLFWKALGNRLRVVEGNAIEVLQEVTPPDVLYLDPMFPQKKKSSPLPPGHIQLLSHIVGSDVDTKELFRTACETKTKRIVVKRPMHADAIGDNLVATHKGKQVRYEVYKPNN